MSESILNFAFLISNCVAVSVLQRRRFHQTRTNTLSSTDLHERHIDQVTLAFTYS